MKFYDFVEEVYHTEAAGAKIAKLFIGEPDLPTPRIIVEAGMNALSEGNTKYVTSQGIPQLREKIAKRHSAKPSQIFVTPGSKFAVWSTVKLLAGNGGEVVTPAPFWPGFEAICNTTGAKIKAVPTDFERSWVPNEDDFASAISPATKLVIICNPSNPTSTVIPKKQMSTLVKIANEKGVTVLIDEAYRGIAFNKIENQADVTNPLAITSGSFSKGFSMTGWRVGYFVAKEETVTKAVGIASSTFSCVPAFAQIAACTALDNPQIEPETARVYEERAKMASDLLQGKLDFAKPQAGFYIFVGRKGMDGDKVCRELLSKGIAIAPGSAFGKPEFLRISLNLPIDQLQPVLERISKAMGT